MLWYSDVYSRVARESSFKRFSEPPGNGGEAIASPVLDPPRDRSSLPSKDCPRFCCSALVVSG